MLAPEAMGVDRVKTELSVQYVDHNLIQEDAAPNPRGVPANCRGSRIQTPEGGTCFYIGARTPETVMSRDRGGGEVALRAPASTPER
jgi:hypothetical protein